MHMYAYICSTYLTYCSLNCWDDQSFLSGLGGFGYLFRSKEDDGSVVFGEGNTG